MMSPDLAIPLALAVPVVGCLAIWLLDKSPNLREAATLLTGAVLFFLALTVFAAVGEGKSPGYDLIEVIDGLWISFKVEPLGMLFAMVASGLWIVTTLYAIGYMRGHHEQNQTRFFTYFAVAFTGVIGVAFAGNLLFGLSPGAVSVTSVDDVGITGSSTGVIEGAKGEAEYETIARIKQMVSIPVIANGDLATPEKSLEVLRLTNADGLMIGRGAQGRPWIFQELLGALRGDLGLPRLAKKELRDIMLGHLSDMHRFYGEATGVRVARKHLTWYCDKLANADEFRYRAVRVNSASEQLRLTREYFDRNDGGLSMAA